MVAAALAGVGVGEVLLHTAYQDDTTAAAAPAATAPTVAPSPAWGGHSNGNHFGSLRDLLLPVPDSYTLGPDSGGSGNDAELNSKQLASREEEALKTVPKKNRKTVEKAWKSLHLRASGLRTYQDRSGGLMVEMRLDQFNQQAVAAASAFNGAVVDASGAFRQGPAVAGHQNARCVLPPLEPSAKIDFMTCFAAEGDLLISMDVTGVTPLDKDGAVQLLKAQLDRLARPGAAV
ncbi:hypothetical protein [Peterkaempfera sp. SMS 1(5)a]|uniref:hypothetical protein n=1 Tax=Peterkaempfera podocarpi TaxID=3232308 RepID=UPI00366D8BF1